jgi:hypothetical protein
MLRHLETTRPDPDGIILHALVDQIAKNGLCIECQKKHNYSVKKQLEGESTDFNPRIMTPGLIIPGGPERIVCEECGGENNPRRNTCRYCKKPLNPRRLYDARGKIYES